MLIKIKIHRTGGIFNSVIFTLLVNHLLTDTTGSSDNGINFYWYNGQSPQENIALNENCEESIRATGITERNQMKIIIHGVNASCSKEGTALTVISAYLEANNQKLADNNVICIDHASHSTWISAFLDFVVYKSAYKVVGKKVSVAALKLISVLLELKVVKSLSDIHIIGHSLGAHVAGIIGRSTKTKLNSSIGRITGLDPGRIISPRRKYQLDSTDATFVDIIHTNALGAGSAFDEGHVDFYPDGGYLQEICKGENAPFPLGTCSHRIVGEYWKKSLLINNALKGCEADWAESWEEFINETACLNQKRRVCDVEVYMGEYTPNTATGKFYLRIPKNYIVSEGDKDERLAAAEGSRKVPLSSERNNPRARNKNIERSSATRRRKAKKTMSKEAVE